MILDVECPRINFFLIICLNWKWLCRAAATRQEAEKADTWCPKSHSLELSSELSKDIEVVKKIPVVAQVIVSGFGACPILGHTYWILCCAGKTSEHLGR